MPSRVALEDAFVLIVGVTRNCANTVNQDLAVLANSFSGAKKLGFFLVESDSSDGTGQKLQDLSEEQENFRFRSLGTLKNEFSKRTERLAICRNEYLAEIRDTPEYRSADYIVVADWDGVNRLLKPNAVASCWSNDAWDVCTANQLGPYYDVWALRQSAWSPDDCWQQKEALQARGMNEYGARKMAVFDRMRVISPQSDWIEVDSAFGGLAIYRKDALTSASYRGLTASGLEICEHVSLHADIRSRGGRIFMNPTLINCGVADHARYATSFGRIKFFLDRCAGAIRKAIP